MLTQCLQQDPDNKEAARAIKLLKVASQKKEEASELFKQNKLEEAIKLFSECVELDALNLTYNATILLNKAIALVKLDKKEQALKELNLCLKYNPQYAKALVKRGEVRVSLEQYDEAVQDFGSAQRIDQTGFGVEPKLKNA